MPHAQAAADLIESGRIEIREAPQLLHQMAVYLCHRGNYEQSERLLLRALSMRERLLGPQHPDIGMTLDDLADVYAATERYAESEQLYVRSLAIKEQYLGPDHPSVASGLYGLASVYREQDEFDKALRLYERALAIWKKALGSSHPSVTKCRQALDTLQQGDVEGVCAELPSKYAFISYANQDGDFVERLKRFLDAHGVAYWDYEENERDYEKLFDLELEAVIEGAEITLSVVTESWRLSVWPKKEFLFSEAVNTPVVVLKAKKAVRPTFLIQGVTFIDFCGNSAIAFKQLLGYLRRKGL